MGSEDGNASDGPRDLSPEAQAFLDMLAVRQRVQQARDRIASLPATPAPQGADLARIRETLGLSKANTVAAAGTDIPGLDAKPLVGLSPALRREAGLPTLDEEYGADRPIQSPNTAAIASRHAEEDILNAIHADIVAAGLGPDDLEGRTVNVHISNETGICHFCFGGLGASRGKDGVIKQFSRMYPGLTVRITAQGGDVRKGLAVALVKDGVLLNG